MVTPEALLSISATSNEYFSLQWHSKQQTSSVKGLLLLLKRHFLTLVFYGHIKGIVEMTNPKEQLVCGECFSIGIDNHFQLSLYMIDNDCQLEIYILFHLT